MKNTKAWRVISAVLAAVLMVASMAMPAGAAENYNQSIYYMIPVQQGDALGYLRYQRSTGLVEDRIPVSQSYSDIGNFGPNGLAPVKHTLKGLYGFMNMDGKWAVEPKFANAKEFAGNGLAAVKDQKTQKWGYANAKGKMVIPAKYTKAYTFHNGLALVLDQWDFYFIDKDGKKQFDIDKNYNYDYQSFSYSRFVVRTSAGAGFMDTKGKLIIAPDSNSPFVRMSPFYSNGTQAVALAEDRYGAWGYIDKNGKWLIQPTKDLDGADMFGTNGLAPSKKGGLYGYIDTRYDSRNTKDRYVIKPQYKDANAFYDNNLATVQNADGKWGVINGSGKLIVPFDYDSIGRITNVVVKY